MTRSTADIEVITLNCWGLKYISKFTTERITHIAEELSRGTSDIVCLQEIWQQEHWAIIKRKVAARLPHAKFFYSGMMGSGLAILSRYPIIQTDMRPYTLNGRPQAFFRGDWFVGKGVASAILELPGGRLCQVFNTHMHAPYNEVVDTYLCHRTAQAWELHKMLGMSVRAGYITFATGDFNSVPGSLVHRFLTTHLHDSFITLHPGLPLLPLSSGSSVGSSEEQVRTFGVTCDVSPLNTWRQTQAPGMEAKRLDYVFHDDHVVPVSVDVVFTEHVRPVGCSASDHFGVRCRYRLQEEEEEEEAERRPQQQQNQNDPRRTHHRPLRAADYTEMEDMLEWYVRREKRHSRLRITHFWASVAILFYLLRMTLVPHTRFFQFLLSIAILIVSVTGLLSGLVGSLFGWSELRSLAEFESELKMAKARVKQD